MVTVKTSELQGKALDYAVAVCEGFKVAFSLDKWAECPTRCVWINNINPSTDWSQGGPIIEREKIRLRPDSGWSAALYWPDGRSEWHIGDTPLIAAMRCYVASKLGDVVDIPDELVVV